MRSLLRFEMKRLLRDRINWIFLVIIAATTFLGLRWEGITAFQGYRYLHQLVVWWAIFSGYRFPVAQRKVGLEEWMDALPYRQKRTMAQLGALFIMFFFATAFMGAMALVAYLFSSLAWHVLQQTLMALVLYYLLSMMIAGTVGWMLGRAFPQVYGYMITAVVGYFLGSMGSVWIYGFSEQWPSIQTILPAFGFPPGTHYSPLAGYDLSAKQWMKYLLWFNIVLFIANIFHGTAKRKKERSALLLMAVLLCGAVGMQEQMGPTKNLLVKDYSLVKQDMEMYDFYNEKPWKSPEFQWKSLNLHIASDVDGLRVEGEGTIALFQEISVLRFNLQRKFTSGTWKVDNVETEVEKDGDVIRVPLTEPRGEGEEIVVRFQYSGIPYGEFTASEKAVILPNYYNWIPQPETGQSLIERGGVVLTVPHHDQTPIEIAVHWDKDTEYWTNVKVTPSDSGVALIAGYVNELESEGITYVYTIADPVAAERNSKPLIEAMRETANDLNIPVPAIRNVVCLQVSELRLNELAGFWPGAQLAGDTLYLRGEGIAYPPFQEGDPDRSLEFFRMDAIVALLLNQPQFLYLDEDMQKAFVHAYVYQFTTYVTKYIPYPELIHFLEQKNDIQGFLRSWYRQMQENLQFSQEDLQELIKEWSAQ